MGNFNTHLGNLGGPNGNGNPNHQGLLLHQHVVKSDLYIATLAENAFGPGYTYSSGDTKTTIDYIMLDIDAASLLESCCTIMTRTTCHSQLFYNSLTRPKKLISNLSPE